MAPITAGTHPLISKPFNIPAANLKIIAFTIKVKRPSVKMLIGKVNNRSMGRRSILKNPTTSAAIMADPNEWILNPGTTTAVRYKKIDEMIQVNNMSVIVDDLLADSVR